MMLGREEVEALRELLAAATPGDWPAPQPSRHGADCYCIGYGSPYIMVAKRQADAALIVAMKNALPALLSILPEPLL